MHKRNQKILGYVLAIFMLVLGVCLGNVKTHSLFVSSSTEHVISLSGSIDGELSLEEFCTEEMIGCDHGIVCENSTDGIVCVLKRIGKAGKSTADAFDNGKQRKQLDILLSQ